MESVNKTKFLFVFTVYDSVAKKEIFRVSAPDLKIAKVNARRIVLNHRKYHNNINNLFVCLADAEEIRAVPKRGLVFRHRVLQDFSAFEKKTRIPAYCVITKVAKETVYYGLVGADGKLTKTRDRMELNRWVADYGFM